MNFEIKDNSEKFKEEMKAKVKNALDAIGMQAVGYAQGAAPVDTGRLRNSISHEVAEDTCYIGTNVEYAPYQELGVPSHNIKAHHFLKNAAANHTSEYQAIAESQLKG